MIFFLQNVNYSEHSRIKGVTDLSQRVKATVACDADHDGDKEVEDEDDSEDEIVEEDKEEEEVVIESEVDDVNDERFELQMSCIKSNTESDEYIEDEEEEDYV